MNRRTLFGGLAAVAAAVAVAPAVQAEAEPLRATEDPPLDYRSWKMGHDAAIRNARAEGYERGRAVESARAESRAMEGYWIEPPAAISWEHVLDERGVPRSYDLKVTNADAALSGTPGYGEPARLSYRYGPGTPTTYATVTRPARLAEPMT